MSNLSRTRLCCRLPLFALALGLTASGCLAQAQTAPQLLPYTKVVVAGGGTSTPASGGKCNVSGFTATDAYGDGCLATEVFLGTGTATPGPRDAIADSLGNIFFGDYANGIVHRIDAVTGVLSDVAGGAASSPGLGSACGTGVSTDSRGDGCNSTLVHLSHPTGLVFGNNGDLYIADYGYYDVRKVANTGGFIPAGGGTISLIAGGTSYGFNVSNATTTVNAATQSLLDGPYSLAFDTQGDLFIADEYEAAVVVVNTNTATSTMVGASPTSNPVSIAPGTIWKIAGTLSSGGPYCGSSGCTYNHVYTDGIQANTDYLRSAYAVAVDPTGNVFITNEYYDTIQKVATSGILTTYAGTNNVPGHALTRGQAGTIAIGSPFGVAADASSNVYFDDAYDGVIWRVDAGTLSQYVIATGFGFSGSGGFASAALPGPGIFGLSVDPYADLFYGDTENNVVGEVASGSQFGPVGANQPTNTLDIHFAKNDTPASSGAYAITAGANNFTTTGVATCTVNSDTTEDCLLPVTATPTTLGRFTGTLTVKSSLGTTAAFPLSGYFVQSPVTRTVVTSASSVTCTGNTYATTTPITFTATLAANGPNPPGGSITFYANNGTTNSQIGTTQSVTNISTTASPVYGAKLTYTFATPGIYTVTAVYSGDSYFTGSTGKLAGPITTSAPGFTAAFTPYSEPTVTAGQTALYSFTLTQNLYSGTITFACSGLPANSSCVFSPSSITATGCSTTNTVALSILTTAPTVTSAGLGLGGRGTWQILAMLTGLGLALALGLRRRQGMRLGQVWMSLALLLALSGALACGKSTSISGGTPSGTYSNITVAINGSAGSSTTLPVTLKVN